MEEVETRLLVHVVILKGVEFECTHRPKTCYFPTIDFIQLVTMPQNMNFTTTMFAKVLLSDPYAP